MNSDVNKERIILKKGIFLLVIFILFSQNFYGQDYLFENRRYYYSLESEYRFTDGYFTNYWGNSDDISELEILYTSPYKIIEDGKYTLLELKDSKHVLFYNNNFLLLYDIKYSGTKTSTSGHFNFTLNNKSTAELWGFPYITASSYLTETIDGKQVSYPPENLFDHDLQLPWVEGEDGDGIGSYLDLDEGVWGATNLIIFNGFFNPAKRYLYDYNNRVKTFLLKSTDDDEYYELIINLEDTPNMQTICLPRRTRSFRLIIQDIYPGTKYNDTCLAGIFLDRYTTDCPE